MQHRSAVVLSIDGLGARMLGPYANTWFATPFFDRLASQSLLLEFAFTDQPELLASCQSLWSTRPQFLGYNGNADADQNELITRLANLGVESTLLTDEAKLADWSSAQQFDRLISEPPSKIDSAASDPSETALAEFFAAAIEQAVLLKPGNLLWLHSQGLSGPWDAPFEMRQQFADEEDPDPPQFIVPPKSHFKEGELDPDERLGFQQACAAQVVLVDQFLGILLENIEKLPAFKQPLLILTAPRGFPMGADGRFGNPEDSLYDDSVHIPVMVRWPNGQHSLNRHQSLCYSSCVSHFVLDWFGNSTTELGWLDNPMPQSENEFVLSLNSKGSSLRTRAWKYLKLEEQERLFVKPDDRWETNDVIRKCRMVGEELNELTDALVSEVKTLGRWQPKELSESLFQNLM